MNLKEIFASKLRNTVQQCQLRGLYEASQWAAEQLMGLEPNDAGNANAADSDPTLPIFTELDQVNAKELSVIMLSFSLLAQGQYQRCAFNIRRYGQEKSKLSKVGLFIYAYSHYMAGEKMKMQQMQSDKSTNDNNTDNGNKSKTASIVDSPKQILNLNLPDLYKELLPFYVANKMDGYLLYIFAIISRDLFRSQGRSVRDVLGLNQDTLNPFIIFQQALVSNPWNWSCWLEFEAYCIDQQMKVPTWDEMMATSTSYRFHYQGNPQGGPIIVMDPVDKQCGRALYAFFLSHFHIEQHRGELALSALEKLQKIFPTSLFLTTHMAVAHYAQRMYDLAEEQFLLLRAKDPYRLQHMSTYSNILYVNEKTAELSLLAHHVVNIDKYSPEVCCVIGNHYSLRGQHGKAVVYFQRAVRSRPEFLSAWTLLGHEYMEMRNSVAAIQCYRHGAALIANKHIVVDDININGNPSSQTAAGNANNSSSNNSHNNNNVPSAGDFRAWYGLGQTYEMLHCYQYALHYYQKAAYLRPDDARIWSAIGNSFLRLHLKSQAMAALERAVNLCQDQEGVATRDLARLYKEEATSQTFNLPFQHASHQENKKNKTMFMRKAAETYYLFLVISNVNNGQNIWSAELSPEDDSNGNNKPEFPPATLDSFFQALKDVHHPAHVLLVSNDDFLSLNQRYMQSTSDATSSQTAAGLSAIVVDAEQAEALLFLGSYCQALRETIAAQYFCSRLLSYVGPEGDQARMLLRELRTDPASYLPVSSTKPPKERQEDASFDNHHMTPMTGGMPLRRRLLDDDEDDDINLSLPNADVLNDSGDAVLPERSSARRHMTPSHDASARRQSGFVNRREQLPFDSSHHDADD